MTVALLYTAVQVDAVADPEGFTPLYMASRRGHEKIVALLLAAGATVAASIGQVRLPCGVSGLPALMSQSMVWPLICIFW